MLNMQLSEIALWTQGALRGTDAAVSGVAIDTRKLIAGELFVALPGSRSDGHDHLAAAVERGAVGALVSRQVNVPLSQIVVDDTQTALGDLASSVRARSHARVVGLTGSNGKTTVKTLAAAILSRHGRTHASAGNSNNELGLPLSVLSMPADSEYGVFEMGAGKPGDIAYLAAIARPQIGLVNNIAPAHLERMKSIEGIAETKGALYSALPTDGVAIINADDRFAEYFTSLAGRRRVLRFALSAGADVRAEAIEQGAGGSRFTLCTPDDRVVVELPLPGRHNIANALAAAAIGVAADVPIELIAAGLAAAPAVPGRLQMIAVPDGWRLIDDSYNANPASLAAAIDTVTALPGEAWLVLGDMGELGPRGAALHAEAGELARQRGVRRLWTVGRLSAAASKAFGPGARHFDRIEDLIAELGAEIHGDVNCLIKGSRAAAMERVVTALHGTAAEGDTHVA